MKIVKRIKASVNKRFEKHPIIGFVLYGVITGFVGSLILIFFLLGLLALLGIYGRLNIDYKTWRLFIIVVAILAVMVFIYGAMAYFPYRRSGKSIFKKEYTKGSSYKALHQLLIDPENDKE